MSSWSANRSTSKQLARRLSRSRRARAAEKRIDFALVLDRDLPVSVVGDALRLRQVLVNLIGNAVKFTERGWVLVEVHPESAPGSSSVRFRVSDTGPGIAADQIELVFERFRQIDSSFSRRFPGAGLGLAICKALVHHMGGSLSAESRLGVGSKFEVTLPLPASAGDRPVPRPWALGRKVRLRCLPEATLRSVTQLLEGAGAAVVEGADPGAAMTGRVDLEIAGPADPSAGAETGDIGPATGTACARRLELVHSLKAEDDPAGSAEAVDRLALPLRPSVLRQYLCELWQVPDRNRGRIRTHDSRAHDMGRLPLRVLVADDDEMGRKITCAMLANMSVRPIAVGDGAEALRAIETSSFDLVFLDLQMPLLDGVEVARRARQLLGEACPRLVALSANVTKADRERCAHVGIRRFVAKPVRPEALLEVLRALELERRGDTAPAPHAVPSGEVRS
jgi:CheY-like chemotaxis protein/anti-sigma regulatory factor (Ser/Thr protein kinase)